jgi:hypothetical protein
MGEARMKFEVGKLYKTRGGEVRRVIVLGLPGTHPVMSIPQDFGTADGDVGNAALTHTLSGTIISNDDEEDEDLMAETREPREWWIGNMGCVPATDDPTPEGYVRVREVLDDAS